MRRSGDHAGGRLRVVMHIGPHKTGTTYMQANFWHHAKALQERGWLYPAIGERVGIAHHDLADNGHHFLKQEGHAYDDLKRVIEQADERKLNVLLSSEGFRRWKPQHFKAIRRMIGNRSLEIVYTLRDPYDMFYSFWAQKVKNGATFSLPEHMRQHFTDPFASHLLNPLIEIEPVLKLKGARYTVLLYDRLRREKRDICQFFLEKILGVGDLVPVQDAAANERLPLEMTEFLRLLSKDSGHPRGRVQARRGLHIGDVLRFLFTAREKKRIAETIRRQGVAARHVKTLSRSTPEFIALEKRLRRRLRGVMRPPPRGRRLFSQEPATWAYYEEQELRQVPDVAR
ncbi:sulfotransferase domain-containing protein, partial [Rhizobium sp. TRM95111]|uniref:sulfotransferase domain-containing protein n=1 Tax=Rhizobium alarense TaxID=2846851 RepID=UPI001F1FFD50